MQTHESVNAYKNIHQQNAAIISHRCFIRNTLRHSCTGPDVCLEVFTDLHAVKMFCILILLTAACFVTGDGPTQNTNVVSVANFAIDFHNRMNNYPYAFKVVKIISDSAQLYPPAWVKYTLQVETAQTVCRNQDNVNLDDCPLQSDAETMICSFVVFAVPGNNTIPKRLLSDQCVSDGRGI